MDEVDDRLHFRCTACGRNLKIAARHAGSRVRCPRCDVELHVPPSAPQGNYQRRRSSAETTTALSDLFPPQKTRHTEDWIDMTAMVDIVFFLLIFFMVTSFNSQQASIALPVPQTEAEGSRGGRKQTAMERFEADGNCIIVRIDDDNSVWLEDKEVPAMVELPGRLREVADKTAASPSELKYVLVLASGDAQHGTAVSVLDAAREAGLTDLRLAIEDSE